MSNIFTWLQCYGTLVSVLAHKFPSKVSEFMAYQSIIIRCYADYEGDGWLAYDRAFRRKAAYEKDLNWSKLNTSFYQFCLAGYAKKNVVCRICLRHDHKAAECPEKDDTSHYVIRARSSGQKARASKSVEICKLFNHKEGNKCHFEDCIFAHLCRQCSRPHPASACPGWGDPAKRAKLTRAKKVT